MSAARPAKRVVILVENLPVPLDRRVWSEATALADAGYRVTVICPDGKDYPAGRFTESGVEICRFRLRFEARTALGYVREYGEALWGMARELWRCRRQGRVDVIHYCNPPDLLWLLAIPLKLLDHSRVIFDQHDLGPELMLAKGYRRGSFMHRFAQVIEKAAYRTADLVIATNESYKSVALKRGSKSPEDVVVVRSGPSRSWGIGGDRTPTPKSDDRHVVAYLGVMGHQEGVHYLLDAANYIRDQHGRRDLTFELVGSGPELQQLRDAARAAGLDEMVTFHGRVPDDHLIKIIGSADVCVNPDEFNEMNDLSTMNKVIEYMALGKPVVQFDLREGRVSAGEASLYATKNDHTALANAILELLDDNVKREQMARMARERFENVLAWETQAPHLIRAYARVALYADPETRP